MARSPFSGTFQPNSRPTVVTAPDAIVYINGESEVIGCPQCNRFFPLNKYITSVQVDLSIDSVPGSASLNLSIPRHTIDDFYFDGNPVITPMMEVEIYAKGYYLLEGLPQYYPIFWGLTTEVSDDYSSGEHTVSIHCADILKWWELCKMSTNPAFTAPSGQQGRSLFGNVFFGMNPYDVIWSLALQSYGDVLIGTGSLVSLYKEAAQRPTFDAALSDLMLYWEQRFSRIRSNLLMYGTNGVAIRGDSLNALYSKNKGEQGKPYASAAVRNANGGKDGGQMVFDPSDPGVTAFRTQFQQAGQINLWQSEYQTKLELANAAKDAAGFEFFMDVDGSVVFKPPFYNLDILGNKPVSWIQDIDIIEWGLSESEAEVVTQIVMQGSMYGNVEYGMDEALTPFTSVTDYHLLRKYGWRSQNYNSEFLGDTQLMFYHGMDVLDRLNSRRHRGTVTIPCRPELRLGFPVYLAPKDQIWYVSGISHNIAFGGRASTTLTLTGKRSKFIAPKGIGTLNLKGVSGNTPTPQQASKNAAKLSFPYTSRQLAKGGQFELKVGNAATLPPTPAQLDAGAGADNPYDPLILRHPKTGRIVGYPNVVMVYTRPFSPADKDIKEVMGHKTTPNPNVNKGTQAKLEATAAQLAQDIDKRVTVTDADRLKEKHMTNRYQYGLNSAGVYIYAHDKSDNEKGVIGEILLLPSKNVTVTPDDPKNKALRGQTSMIRPVSDERGFEVIGHFRYGRRVALRDGRLILTDKFNEKTNIDLQFALGGGLFETLQAQSQGLTTISTTYANPANSIAQLQPEDLQTAAVQEPGMKEPKYTSIDNFVDTAPLGSPEQKGVTTSVEAGQLSRALTLAEMTVKEKEKKVDDTDCPCITGRSDLAFMNVGYQLKTINSATPVNTGVSNATDGGPIGVDQSGNLTRNIASLQGQITALKDLQAQAIDAAALARTGSKANPPGASPAVKAADQKVKDLDNRIKALEERLEKAEKARLDLAMQKSFDGTNTIPSGSELIGRVETFLTKLYNTLDDAHQQHEHAIRGDLLPGGAGPNGANPDPDFFTPEPTEFAPPFSAPNRFAIGDPRAIAGQANTAFNDISKQWEKFGSDLKKNAVSTQLNQEISLAKSDIARLTSEKTRLQQSIGNTTSFPSPQQRIAEIDKDLQRLNQQVHDAQTRLNTL